MMTIYDAAYKDRQAWIAELGGKFTPDEIREIKVQQAKEMLGEKYLCHPANQIQRKAA